MRLKLPMWFKRLKIVFMPSYWFKTYNYSPKWERELTTLMSQHRFEPIYKYNNLNIYYCKLGDKYVWISNHPYASYNCYGNTHNPFPSMYHEYGKYHPSRYMAYLAHKKRLKDFKYYEEQKIKESKLVNGDGISPRKTELNKELLKWC